MKSTVAFEAIFALLAYGLFLFPNVDKFVDINAIRIFMIGNPIPTLLGDAYYYIDLWNSYHGGMIMCCTPLLYRWFISHMPQSDAFWDVKKEPRWAPKIMALTHSEYRRCLTHFITHFIAKIYRFYKEAPAEYRRCLGC